MMSILGLLERLQKPLSEQGSFSHNSSLYGDSMFVRMVAGIRGSLGFVVGR